MNSQIFYSPDNFSTSFNKCTPKPDEIKHIENFYNIGYSVLNFEESGADAAE